MIPPGERQFTRKILVFSLDCLRSLSFLTFSYIQLSINGFAVCLSNHAYSRVITTPLMLVDQCRPNRPQSRRTVTERMTGNQSCQRLSQLSLKAPSLSTTSICSTVLSKFLFHAQCDVANMYVCAALESSSYILGNNQVGKTKVFKGHVILTLSLSNIRVGGKTIY